MTELRRVPALLRDPRRGSMIVGVALVAVGFGSIAAAWKGTAATAEASEQVAFVLSGGFGGFGTIVVGLAVTSIQWRRVSDQNELRALRRIVEGRALKEAR